MNKQTVTLMYVNNPEPPKRKNGSIVDTAGNRFGVEPKEVSQFQVGRTYEIEVEPITLKTGSIYNKVKSATPVNGNGASSKFPSPVERGQRIERQHSQQMSISFLAKFAPDATGMSLDEAFDLVLKFT